MCVSSIQMDMTRDVVKLSSAEFIFKKTEEISCHMCKYIYAHDLNHSPMNEKKRLIFTVK
jgi:hypothetical protein